MNPCALGIKNRVYSRASSRTETIGVSFPKEDGGVSVRMKGFSAPQIKDYMFPDNDVLYALPVQLELGLSLESFRQAADLCIPLAGWLMK